MWAWASFLAVIPPGGYRVPLLQGANGFPLLRRFGIENLDGGNEIHRTLKSGIG